MDAVVVWEFDGCQNLRAVKMNVTAVGAPVAPSGRLIAHGDVLDEDVPAADEHDYARGGDAADLFDIGVDVLIPGEDGMRLADIGPQAGLFLGDGIDKRAAMAVDFSPTGDSDIFTALGIDEAAFIEARAVF